MFRALARFSVHNRVTVHLLALLVIVAGLSSYAGLTREIFPEFTRNRILVTTLYPGASPEDVEELISIKIEDAIDAVDGVETIESTSQEGVSWVSAYLVRGTNVDRALQDIDRAVAAVSDLPEDAEEPLVTEVKTQFPVITLSIYGELSELALKDLVRPIKRRMESIPGVAQVRPSGFRDVEWHVEVDPEALVRYGLTVEQVSAALGRQNLNLPGGLLERPRDEVVLRTKGETRTARQIEAVPIRALPDGSHVRVGDVAQVRPGFARAADYGRLDGKPALNLTALKDTSGDILAISAAVRELADELVLPAGVSAAVHTDLSVFLQSRLDIMRTNAIQGFVLVFVCLYLLLDWRMALLVAMGIPLAFLVAFAGMAVCGISLNMMSLFALILVLGMLVDDAIVVTENIQRRMEEGEPPEEAAVNGLGEVALPVLGTVLTTVAAFLPMILTPGEMGEWMRQVPLVVSLCLLGSLFECYYLLPCHVAELARPTPHDPARPGRFARFRARYEAGLAWVLERRYEALAAALGFSLLLVTWTATRIKFTLFGEFESDTYFLNFELPSTTALDETSERARALEAAVLSIPAAERRAVITNIGIAAVDVNRADRGTYLGQVVVNLVPPEERSRSANTILDQVRALVTPLPGFTKLEFKGLQAGPGGAAIEVALLGDDLQALRAGAEEVEGWLRAQSGVREVHDDWAPGKSELEVQVDQEAAQALGLSTADVALQVRGAFQGREATTVRRVDEDVEIVVRFPADARAERRALEELWLTTPGGQTVPFQAVARLVEGRGLARILRGERRRSITVLGDVDTARANALDVTRRLEERFEGPLAAQGLELQVKGQRREAEQSLQGLAQALLLALVLIYFILGTQFRSFTQPVLVMLAIPFGIDGILLGHALLGVDLSFLSMMGLVATTGIVVNDSLVLVEVINQLRREGRSRLEAVVEGSARRLRPIFLTTITTVLGLAPLAFFSTGQARFLSPMAMSIVFGLSLATALTLVVIPCLYMALDDLEQAAWRRLRRAPAPEGAPGA